MSSPDHHVDAVDTAFRIVDALDRSGRMGVTAIAQETGIAKSSVYKHLDTLRRLGYVRKEGEEYALSLRWFEAGRGVRDRSAVYRAAKPEVDRLASRAGETASLVVEEDGEAVYLYQTSAEEPVAPVGEGERIPTPLSVGGKAIYSYRPESEVRERLAAMDVDAETDRIVAELRELRDQRLVIERDDPLQGASSAGAFEGHRHVVGHDEPYRNLHSLAVPIRDAEDRAIAAIEVSGAESSLYGRRLEEEIAGLVVDAGRSVETAVLQSDERRER